MQFNSTWNVCRRYSSSAPWRLSSTSAAHWRRSWLLMSVVLVSVSLQHLQTVVSGRLWYVPPENTSKNKNELRHDKTNKMSVRPAKTQIRLLSCKLKFHIHEKGEWRHRLAISNYWLSRSILSGPLDFEIRRVACIGIILSKQWTKRSWSDCGMCRLICIFVVCICHKQVFSWCCSNNKISLLSFWGKTLPHFI